MNKKLILLILALPLILMISLFTATSTVSLAVPVPVSKIEIAGDDIVYLDLDAGETYQLEYTVYPTTAANQEVVFSTEKVGDSRLCELEYVGGYIVPRSSGKAKVTLTTVDGAFKDSIVVQVDSNSLESIDSSVSKTQIYVGEKVNIFTNFVPSTASNKLVDYVSSNPAVATVDDKGGIVGVGKGTAIITVSSEADPSIKDTIQITVINRDTMDLGQSEISTSANSGSINISVDSAVEYELSYVVLDEYGNEVTDIVSATFDETNKEDGNIVLNFNFIDASFIGDVVVRITLSTESGIPVTKECVLTRVNKIALEFDEENNHTVTLGTNNIYFTLSPSDAEVEYTSIAASNDNIANLYVAGSRLVFTAVRPGITTITLEATDVTNSSNKAETSIDIVILPAALDIAESGKTYGIENIWTLGKTNVNGSDSAYGLTLSYKQDYANGKGFVENLTFKTDSDKVSIYKNGIIKILDESFTGLVDFYAVFEYNGVEYYRTESFTVRCVGNGINVSNYIDLYKATAMNRPIILHGDIKDDFGYDENGNIVYTEIETTYDKTHYVNIDKEKDAKVKVLLAFRSDLYGNGHVINAHNITYGLLDATGVPKDDTIFRGPLNFVSMTEGEGSAVSVKAQDNICFAIYEGVTVNNVELRGCDLTPDPETGNNDLTDLNYVGTTVEVLGDNVTIKYSRITNGRTVLRIFGDETDATKVINVRIENSVLSSAREFIMRIGSNRFVDGTKENPSPTIDTSFTSFPAHKTYQTYTEEKKDAYDEKYIQTFVTVKDSAFRDAGIFAVGMDAHFAGAALADGSEYNTMLGGLINHWQDLAKTSYGAKLTLEGNVRMYCWKPLDDVDSSTLIEIVGESQYKDKLDFNVKNMVEVINEKEGFESITYNHNGKKYVHAGIAIFGGGKNYCIVDDNTNNGFNNYEVSLADVNASYLQVAAGLENFYFVMHSANTGYLPTHQEADLASGNAYDFIYPAN